MAITNGFLPVSCDPLNSKSLQPSANVSMLTEVRRQEILGKLQGRRCELDEHLPDFVTQTDSNSSRVSLGEGNDLTYAWSLEPMNR